MMRWTSLRSEDGQSLVEMAIMINLLVLIVAGLVDLSRGFQAYIVIVNAAREGAVAGSDSSLCLAGTQESTAKTAAKNEATSSGIVLSDGHISVRGGCTAGAAITVTINYDLALLTGTILGAGPLRLSYTVQMSTF
jgi:Flp pilus assembly protein TadG